MSCLSHVDWAPIILAALHFGALYTGEDWDPIFATWKVSESGGHLEDITTLGTNGGKMAIIGPVWSVASLYVNETAVVAKSG